MSAPRRHRPLDVLLYDECKQAISQARLCETDYNIATLYLLERMPQIEVADTLDIARSTISRRLPEIEQRIEYVAKRIGYI